MASKVLEYIPPAKVAQNAAKGLKMHNTFGHGGTRIGLTRAHQLQNQQSLSPETIQRMVSYFARHEVDKKAENFGNDSTPSKGYIAWLLWGGDEGREWALEMKKTFPKT